MFNAFTAFSLFFDALFAARTSTLRTPEEIAALRVARDY